MYSTVNSAMQMRRPSRCNTCIPGNPCAFLGTTEFHRIAQIRFYGRGSTVLRQNDPATNILVIRSGWLQLTHTRPSGKSVADLAGPGSIIGAQWALTESNHAFTAVALEDCEIEQADVKAFLDLLRAYPDAAVEMLRHVSRQFRRSLDSFYYLSGKTPPADRLIEALREISATCGVPVEDGTRIRLPLSVQVLADKIGCSRQWASKLLGDLEACGAIRRRRGWITLTNNGAKPAAQH